MDEKDVLQSARKGDLDAFNQLVLTYQNQAYGLAYRMIGEAEAAADAAQQAFLSAYQHLGDLRGESFRSWLMRIVSNACLDELRRRKRKPTLSVEAIAEDEEGDGDPDSLSLLADSAEGPESATVRSELRRAIEDCLQRLAPDMRATILLADVHTLEYVDVASTLRIAVGTVKSRVARARSSLRDCLQRQSGELLPAAYRLKEKAQE